MTVNRIIRWWKDIWGKTSSTPAESDEMNSDKPISVSGSTTIIASEPVGATGMTSGIAAPGANPGATGPSEVQ